MKIRQITEPIEHGFDLLKGQESIDKTYQSRKTFSDESAARQAFVRATERLFAVDRWSDLSNLTANFWLYDSAGEPKPMGRPTVGDYIKIDLPGPTPVNWVTIVKVIEEESLACFTARPCPDPHEKVGQTEHFLTSESTSTFCVERHGTTLTASQIGKNETVNNQGAEAGDRKVVNTMVAGVGWLFYQQIQWQTLTDYLVEVD